MTNKPDNKLNKKNKHGAKNAGDDDLWDHVTATIKPLGRRQKNRTPGIEHAALPIAGRAVGGKSGKNPRSMNFGGQKAVRPRPSLPELTLSNQAGLDKSTAKKLKKGNQRIEARIDLHGMTQAQAHRALDSFIDGAYHAAKRCVLVITGKGFKLDGSIGVIRAAVPRWLNEQPNRARVLAISQATPKDGGEGALYVMLKRKR